MMSSTSENNNIIHSEHHVNPVATIITFIIIIALIGGGIAGAIRLIKTKPEVTRKKPVMSAPLVRIVKAQPDNASTEISVMGTVQSAETVMLKPRVTGEIISVSPSLDPGGIFEKGAPLVNLDKTDYDILLTQRKAALAQVESNFAVEKGRHAVAGKDVDFLETELTENEERLARREPQLAAVRASVESARSAVTKAELDLSRTVIKAPFHCVVVSRLVSKGDTVNASTPVAEVAGTDEFRIEVSVPVNQLRWISIPMEKGDKGSPAKIYYPAAWGEGYFRTGTVHSLSPELISQGRMAKIYVSVSDPLSLKPDNKEKPKLILGSFVRLEIKGKELSNVISVPRSVIHDGNTVWVASPEDTLEIRPIKTAWVSLEKAYISGGLKKDERIIISDLAAPIAGMKIHPVTTEGKEVNGKPDSGEGKPGMKRKEASND